MINKTFIPNVDSDGNQYLPIVPYGTPGIVFGQVDTAATTMVRVYKTAYTEQTTNAQRSLVSTSGFDLPFFGGLGQARITYYKADFTGPFTEDINLNGTTPVNTVSTTICYIEKIEMISTIADTNGVTGNSGTISLFAGTAGAGAVIATIPAGDNVTKFTHHYVATGKTCNITSFVVASTGTTAARHSRFTLYRKILTGGNLLEMPISSDLIVSGVSSATIQRTYNTPITVTGPALVFVQTTPNSATADTQFASFTYTDV